MAVKEAPQVLVPFRQHQTDATLAPINIQPDDDIEAALAKTEMWVATTLGQELLKFYPGREWRIECDARNGVVTVQCMDVSTTHGHRLSLSRTLNDLSVQMKRVGGEILERGRLSRSPIASTGVLDEIEAAPRDLRDSIKGSGNG
jgi:hypothetical protein